ncbi:OmpH family outer membrane protein [Haloferula sargassicola]|uniref:OmpH family outer membrane protein n=1 Tax=Haloferula sargassicola TaxID=490096 RepID=A0ABP9UI68_9BACT
MLRVAIAIMALGFGCASAAPKIAGVRISDIYQKLQVSHEIEDRATEARRAIGKDPRFAALAEAVKKLEELEGQLAKSQDLDRLSRERLQQQYLVKRDEEASLRREVQLYQAEQLKTVNERMVSEMTDQLGKIQEAAAGLAREKGFDLLLDLSGKTNTSLPFVVYAKDPVDLTDEVVSQFTIVDAAQASPSEP